MSIGGVFRQHFALANNGKDSDSKILQFLPVETTGGNGTVGASGEFANITCENALMTAGGGPNTVLTMSVWVYPVAGTSSFESANTPHTIASQLDEDNVSGSGTSYIQISSDGKVNFKFRQRLVSHNVATISYSQWNHILISMSASTTGNDIIHLVVNGTRYTYQSGNNNISGTVTIGNGDQIIDPDDDFNFHMGYKTTDSTYSEGTNAFKGSMYQFYFDNQYYDMSQSSNILKFRTSGGNSLPNFDLPNQSPLILITDFKTFNSGINGPGIIVRNRVSTSTLPKP